MRCLSLLLFASVVGTTLAPHVSLAEEEPPARLAPTLQSPQPKVARAIQDQLRRYGFYKGPIDGIWSQATVDALLRFQGKRDLPITGQATRATMTALGLRDDL